MRLRILVALLPPKLRRRLTIALLNMAGDDLKLALGVPSLQSVLRNMQRVGFSPKCILDIGAYHGEWTKLTSGIFTDAHFWMIEAQPQKMARLNDVARGVGADRAMVINALLGAEEKSEVEFNLMETGSSVLPENTAFPRTTTKLPMTTLDTLIAARMAGRPDFIKIDAQGYELEVLKGGLRALGDCEACLLETSLIEYNAGSPMLADVVGFMSAHGFVVYDLCGQSRRHSDASLFQLDVMFIKEDSNLRARRKFWNHEP
jgi:FkbM family methyltransferase